MHALQARILTAKMRGLLVAISSSECFLRLVLCSLLGNAHDDDKYNNSSVCQLVMWSTDGEIVQEVQVKMVEALKSMNTFRKDGRTS